MGTPEYAAVYNSNSGYSQMLAEQNGTAGSSKLILLMRTSFFHELLFLK